MKANLKLFNFLVILCGYFKQIIENPKFGFYWGAGSMVRSM